MPEEAKREGMKRRVTIRTAFLICVMTLLTFCDLSFDLDLPDPTLNITAQTIYLSDTEISIQFSFTAEEEKHLCRYTLAKNNGSGYTVVEEGEEELVAGQVYERTYTSLDGEGQYRFSFSVLIERDGVYETPPFLQDSIIFWVDPTPPSGSVSISVPGGSYNSARDVVLDHPELDTIDGSPAQIFYTTDENEPNSASTLYVPGEPVTITADCTLKAVAIDLADRPSGISSETYTIDSVPPIAPNIPTTTEGPYINEYEQLAGFDVNVELGTSGAGAEDELELLLGGYSFPSPLIHVLTAEDIAVGSCTFTVDPNQLGSDGTKQIKARVTDLAGNVGADSGALILTLDTMDPILPTTDKSSGIFNYEFDVTIDHPEWPTSASGSPVKLFYTLDGTNPDSSSIEYNGSPISLSDGTTQIRVIATDDAGNVSGELTENYVIDTIAPVDPFMDHSSSDYSSPFDLVITHPEIQAPTGTEVHYTLDESTPNRYSNLYEAPIRISGNTEVKAIAIDQADNESSIISGTYTFLRAGSIAPSSCPIDSSYHFFNIDGFFGIFFDGDGDYIADSLEVYLSQDSAQVECVIVDVASTTTNLYIQIWGQHLIDEYMVPGMATITVINTDNGDSDSAPFALE